MTTSITDLFGIDLPIIHKHPVPDSAREAAWRQLLAPYFAEYDAARTTAVTNVFTGRPARGIVNRLMREIGPVNGVAPAFPLAATAVFALRSKAEPRGVDDFTSMWAGQSAALCPEMPAAELTRTLAAT